MLTNLIHLWPLALFALGVIGLQRAVTTAILATAAGATAQTGLVFAVPNDWSSSDEIAYQITIAGGTFSALTVTISLSLDGVNFPVNQVSDTTHANAMGVIEAGTTLEKVKAPFLQAAISNGTVASGSPTVTVTIWPR